MMMDRGIFRHAKVTTEKERFDPLEEGRVSCHHIYKFAVLRAGLAHNYLAVFLHDLRLDLARMFIHQGFQRGLSGNDSGTNFLHTSWTETVSLARKTQRRRAAFV